MFPLPEQRRIVAKVDEPMALCNDLEARLTEAHDAQVAFAASTVYHLDAAGYENESSIPSEVDSLA